MKRKPYRIIVLMGTVLAVIGITGCMTACSKHSYFEEQDGSYALDGTDDADGSGESNDADNDATDKNSDASDGTGRKNAGTDGSGGVNAGGVNADGASTNSNGTGADGQASGSCFVHITGAVKTPGVYEMSQGSRVFQVIEQAGGLTKNADGSSLNQAAEVFDGQQIYVYRVGEDRVLESAGNGMNGAGATGENGTGDNAAGAVANGNGAANGSAAGITADGKVNLNTATKEQLTTLPGIGDAKADAILTYREEHGMFAKPEDIKNVSGIGDATYQKLSDLITV